MAIIKGKKLRLKFDSGTVYHATECSMTSDLAFTDVSTKDTDGVVSSPDEITWSISISSLAAHKATGSGQKDFKDLIDAHVAKTLVPVEFTSDEEAELLITGNVYVQSWDLNAPNEGNATCSVTLKGDGIYTPTLVPAA